MAGLVAAVTVAVVPAHAIPTPAPEEPPLVTAPDSPVMTVEQALARARQTDAPVPVDAAKTSTDEVTANPDGTLTLSRSVSPTRKRVGDQWWDLDATLGPGPGGSVAPAVTSSQLTLSGGGSGPMATMASAGMSVAFTLPMTLPQPTLDGDSATYTNVLPDVDLVVTADIQGGLSHVFVVHTAEAAANPALQQLTVATQTTGVTMSADAAGNITGRNRTGQIVLTAPTPMAWDSTTAPAARTAPSRPDDHSTVDGPGAGARLAPIAVQVTTAGIELTPDATLLTGPETTYPVYVDPTFTWSSVGAANNGWATIPAQHASTNYWKTTPDPRGRMQVGYSGEIRSRTLVNFPIATTTLAGATINTARLDITQTHSYSCTASRVNLFAPGTTLTQSNASWNAWSGVSLGSVADYQDVAHGYNSSCPAAGVSFDVKAAVSAAVNSNKKTQTFALVAQSETDTNGWKEFLQTSPRLTVTYNHTPNKPTGMTTSPATSCTAATPTTVGDGQVTLYAPVSDRNGGVLGVRFNLWKTSTPGTILASSDPNLLTYPSSSTAVLVVPLTTLRTAAGGTITQFSWRVQATDFNKTSDWSTTCNFKFDPTRTGPPTVSQPDSSAVIGQSVTVTVTPPATGSTPSGYLYQLNGGPPGNVTATSGNATITVTPPRFTNTLTVTSLSPGGNIGEAASVTFNATPAETAPDGDLTGDGVADLLTVGATNNLPSGLWLGAGKNTGQVVTATTNIGANGNGVRTTPAGTELTHSPTDFNSAQIITGHFTGTGLQDVLVYYPTGYAGTSGENAGGGVVLRGNGDGTAIPAHISGTQETIWAGLLSDMNGLNPLQVANAGTSSGSGHAFPDLIAIAGDPTIGYYLNYYPNQGSAVGWAFPPQLTTPTPTGGVDWNTWTIATAQTSTGTAMFLWQRSTGALHLWTNLAFDINAQTFSHTAHTLRASGWNTNAAVKLHATDVDGNDTADLWTVGANGATTAHLVSNLTAGAGTITAQTGQSLLTSTHAWFLNDHEDGPVTGTNTATDTVGTLAATGAGNAAWNSGDLYDPDVAFDGTNSTLTTTGPALATNADFTVSAWVKPHTAGGTVLSQDGTNGAGFKLWAEAADKSWRFALSTTDSATAGWDTTNSAPNTVRPGIWTHLTATYKRSTGLMELFVNGVKVSYNTHTTVWNAGGTFRFGAHRTSNTAIAGHLNGQVAHVLVWNQDIDPAQAVTPPSYYQPIAQVRALDTRNNIGGTNGPLPPGSTIRLRIAGANGIPATNVTAVAMSLTVVSPSGGGHVRVWPDNTPRPATAALDFGSGVTIANYVITAVGANGYINLYNNASTIHLLADITGYFTSDETATGNTSYTPTTPTRLLDTRNGTGGVTGPLPANSTTTLQVTGTAGVPTGAKAVAVNFTILSPDTFGFLTTYADGTTRPGVSGLQFPVNGNIAAMSIVPVGTNGKIAIFKSGGTNAHLIADILGYFTTGTNGQKYHPINATRMIDTRRDGGPVPSNSTKTIAQGNTVIANAPTLILNVTITQPTAGGYLTTYDASTTRPLISNMDFAANQTIAGLTLPTANQGTVAIYTSQTAGATSHLVIDCLGYFANT
ncbi:LamG-like jellyroll fold domain-containing protein [Phytohabitans sp. ZYX-F-186]|uniref:LamG-like jellyroll fold domain-containing protein n=1 Tax=Phytohabitans maris TaxID=3071409 RepID=A0ABU0ZYW1_9ACTN|nr:LamG-like jellyroll fold domain-containing protein [Phytohabitans sp. ZYX-F-186]MDQ7911375.1 LamG-like jellyroll fold domain-containing protein [Phytohabitans sp. ZYX-F-186]